MRSRIVSALVVGVVGLSVPTTLAAQVSVEADVATQIVDRMPVSPATSFPADVGEVFCWTRVTGAAGTTMQHVWIHGDMEFPVTVQIGGSPWRTWTSKVIPPEWSGEWRVEIRDAAGTVLTTESFTVGS